jgi:ABC-type branched-subunit amino acid transport system substrate-binding protein
MDSKNWELSFRNRSYIDTRIMIKHKSLYTFALAVLSLLLFPFQLEAQVKPLKIGVVLCLSGGCQQTGTHALNGMMLARDEINSKGGILNRPVELVVQDSREVDSPSYSVSADLSGRVSAARWC